MQAACRRGVVEAGGNMNICQDHLNISIEIFTIITLTSLAIVHMMGMTEGTLPTACWRLQMQKTWFAVLWGPNGCHIDGPFGDDVETAREFIRRELGPDGHYGSSDGGAYEMGGVFAVDLEMVETA